MVNNGCLVRQIRVVSSDKNTFFPSKALSLQVKISFITKLF